MERKTLAEQNAQAVVIKVDILKKKKKKARELEMSLFFNMDRCVGSRNNRIETSPKVYWVAMISWCLNYSSSG